MKVVIVSNLGENQNLSFDDLASVRTTVAAAIPENAEAVTVHILQPEEDVSGKSAVAEEDALMGELAGLMGTPTQQTLLCAIDLYNSLIESMRNSGRTVDLAHLDAVMEITKNQIHTGIMLAATARKLDIDAECLRDGRIRLPDNITELLIVRGAKATGGDTQS